MCPQCPSRRQFRSVLLCSVGIASLLSYISQSTCVSFVEELVLLCRSFFRPFLPSVFLSLVRPFVVYFVSLVLDFLHSCTDVFLSFCVSFVSLLIPFSLCLIHYVFLSVCLSVFVVVLYFINPLTCSFYLSIVHSLCRSTFVSSVCLQQVIL